MNCIFQYIPNVKIITYANMMVINTRNAQVRLSNELQEEEAFSVRLKVRDWIVEVLAFFLGSLLKATM